MESVEQYVRRHSGVMGIGECSKREWYYWTRTPFGSTMIYCKRRLIIGWLLGWLPLQNKWLDLLQWQQRPCGPYASAWRRGDPCIE